MRENYTGLNTNGERRERTTGLTSQQVLRHFDYRNLMTRVRTRITTLLADSNGRVLGSAAAGVAPAFQHVFSTGNPLPNFELTARLPSRSETGHWIENYYPIKAGSGKVLKVGVIVLEITKRKNVEQSLDRLTSKLHRAAKILKTHGGIRPQAKEQAALSAQPLNFLKIAYLKLA
jgi:hypothetical protein